MNQNLILVTGASSDIGLETVKLLLRSKEFVWGIYRNNEKELHQLKKLYPKNLSLTKYNFIEKNEIYRYLDEVKEKQHQIKAFISLAAMRGSIEYGNISVDDLNNHFVVNTIPVVLAVQQLGDAMSKLGYGRIVIGSSIGVKFGGGPQSYCYSITKFASEFLPSKAKDWSASNVLSNIVRIGVTASSSMKDENLIQRSNLIPMRRPATPIEIANFLVWLSSDKNTYITNQLIPVSGGE